MTSTNCAWREEEERRNKDERKEEEERGRRERRGRRGRDKGEEGERTCGKAERTEQQYHDQIHKVTKIIIIASNVSSWSNEPLAYLPQDHCSTLGSRQM